MEITEKMQRYIDLSNQCDGIPHWQTSQEHLKISQESLALWMEMTEEEQDTIKRFFASTSEH